MFKRNMISLLRLSFQANNVRLREQIASTNQIKVKIRIGCKYLSTNTLHFQENITFKSKEEEYLVKIKDDPDTFGCQRRSYDREEPEEGDLKEQEYLENSPNPEEKLRTKQYADIIKAFIRKKKIKEAIDVLEVRMLNVDHVKPESYIYNLILGACGRVGYTKKAFALYNKMKQRGLKATGGTYTALFNSCANSPWPQDGLTRARHLREIMIEKRYEPNDTNYNAMIKAFGHCGDLETAFSLVDEMQEKKFPIKEDTLNFLLQACISDKEAGFRHALLVWRKFHEKNVKPDIYSYNLLLRCVRDCGLGDIEITKNVFDRILLTNEQLLESSNTHTTYQNTISNFSEDTEHKKQEDSKDVIIVENRPNLINKIPQLGSILSVSEITKAEDRLLLIGGCSGFLRNMKENHCTPSIKTFTQLLDTIPSTLFTEKELIVLMKKFNVRPDADFYNMLIKKRSMRCDYDLAKEVLSMMKSAKLKPNIITYGVLSLGCKTKEEAESLMIEMKNANHRMNAEILGAMLHQACYHTNFPYVLKIMETCIEEEIRPNKKFMDRLEEFKKKCKYLSNDNTCDMAKSKGFKKGFEVFKMRYKNWKEQVDPINEEEIHPWQQFRQENETNVKHYKDKDMSSRFKPRHTSLYRQNKNKIIRKAKVEKNKIRSKKDVLDIQNIKQINPT